MRKIQTERKVEQTFNNPLNENMATGEKTWGKAIIIIERNN